MRKNILPIAACVSLGLTSFSQLAFSKPIMNENPFVGAQGYVNPDYVKEVSDFFNRNPAYKSKAENLGLLDKNGQWKIPTAIWIDSRAAIDGEAERGTHSITSYLNDALTKATAEKPVILTFVIYDLPLRDCDAYSSNGEFKSAEDLPKYKNDYIDKIKSIFDVFYEQKNAENVRIALVIEPDSLPNLITNTNHATCSIAASKNVYADGIQYALKQFSSNPKANISMYLDISHSGWLGWADNANKISEIYSTKKLGNGFNQVRGFITNTSNYTPLKEAFTYDEYLPNYVSPKLSKWIMTTQYYSWNEVYDETSYIAEIMSLQEADGKLNQPDGHRIMPPAGKKYANMHFLIDTSRNGWMKNESDYLGVDGNNKTYPYDRLDQRHHRGNWCNIQNIAPDLTNYDNPEPKKMIPSKLTSTGFGELPQVNPKVSNPLYADNEVLPIDAYVWIKPPGESDGFYDATTQTGDQMCGPADGGAHDDSQRTDSLQNGNHHAPKAGLFFDSAFMNLIDVSGCIKSKFTSRFCS